MAVLLSRLQSASIKCGVPSCDTPAPRDHLGNVKRQFETNAVPADLVVPNATAPVPNEWLFDPAQDSAYEKAYETVQVLLHVALVQASEVHNPPEVLLATWHSSFPAAGSCDDVDFICAQQLESYTALVARIGRQIPDEERVQRLRDCFSATLQAEFTDMLAKAHISKSFTPWGKCKELAQAAQRVVVARLSHVSPSPSPFVTPPTTPRLPSLAPVLATGKNVASCSRSDLGGEEQDRPHRVWPYLQPLPLQWLLQ